MANKILVPKVVFDPSCIYYRIWKSIYQGFVFGGQYPEYEEILEYTKRMEKCWNRKKRGILEELASVTCLEWKRKEITCFIVGPYPGAFSHPLTVSTDTFEISPERFLSVLIHELIHNIFIDNTTLLKNRRWVMNYLDRRYGEETSVDMKIHILVHAIHAHIHCKFFDGKPEEVLISKNPDYKKSWEIVQNEGYEQIIHEFAKYVSEMSGGS